MLYENRTVVSQGEFTTDNNGNFMIWDNYVINVWLYPYNTYWADHMIIQCSEHYWKLVDKNFQPIKNREINVRWAVVYNGWSGLT